MLTLRKPMSHDVEVVLNYTYSHALDNGQTAGTNGTFFGTDGVLDPYNLKQDYANSDLDQRQRFVGSVVWQPTYAKDVSNAYVRQLANGWTVSGHHHVGNRSAIWGDDRHSYYHGDGNWRGRRA